VSAGAKTSAAGSNPALPALRKIFDVAMGYQSGRTIAKVQNVCTQIAQVHLGDFALYFLIALHTPVNYRSSDG
jgi:hypothetical protein